MNVGGTNTFVFGTARFDGTVMVTNTTLAIGGTTVTFRYDPKYPSTDFSRTVTLEPSAERTGPTRLFEPVYAGFQGIDVSDASPACVPRLSVVNGTERLPLLLSAQLPPGWVSQSQYQRITRSR